MAHKLMPITVLALVIGCNSEHSKVFYCQTQPTLYPERQCHLQVSNIGCTDESFNHGGCFERPVAYCFSRSLLILEYCIKQGGLGTKEYIECDKTQRAWAEIQTSLAPSQPPVGRYVLGTSETECDVTLEECQSARRDVMHNRAGAPPLLTVCVIASPNEVNPL